MQRGHDSFVFCDGFRVWDPGEGYGILGFNVMRQPFILASFLLNKTEFFWRSNALWYGVEANSSSLLDFSLISIPYKLVEVVLYCFNESLYDYCTVNTTIKCIGK